MNAGITLITGGVRAGKSALAERLAATYGEAVLYLATAESHDDEMAARIEVHRAARPPSWRTVEAPRDPVAALLGEPRPDAVLLDCLTVWTSNVLLDIIDVDRVTREQAAEAEETILRQLEALLVWQSDAALPLIAVTNEVGLGVVPATAIGRLYRDVLGRVNQRVAAVADEVFLVVAGLALPMRELGAVPIQPATDGGSKQDHRSAER